MRLLMIGPGRFKERWQREAFADYVKRLSRFMSVELRELPDAPDQLPLEQALKREAEAILAQLHPTSYMILLDLAGQSPDSVELARLLRRGFEQGGAEIILAHGGSRGVHRSLQERANLKISLSRLTFTHLMSRVLILEQVYRAAKINAGEAYHK